MTQPPKKKSGQMQNRIFKNFANAGAQVRRALSGFKGLEWHTRTGAPHCLADLEMVAAGQATSVILLNPEQEQVRMMY